MLATHAAAPSSAHLDYLDGWRGVAILLLWIGHFCPVPGFKLDLLGVQWFFVLSGLLMARLLFVQQTPLPRFYWRRFSRILPAHLAFIALICVTYALCALPVSATESLSALVFLKNYLSIPSPDSTMPFGHIWSLSVEEHSYLVLSLLALSGRRLNWSPLRSLMIGVTVLLLIILFYGWRVTQGADGFAYFIRSEFSSWGIFISALLLIALPKIKPHKLPLHRWLSPICLTLGSLSHWWSVPLLARTLIGVSLLALAINTLHTAPASVRQLLSWPPLRQLGIWSFSLYLWQQPFYVLAHQGKLSLPLALIAALVCGLFSFYLIEQPARRRLNRTQI